MAASTKGLIVLEPRSAILYEQLRSRILQGKREPCEINFCDFDDVSIRIACDAGSVEMVTVHMTMKNIAALKRLGTQDIIDRLYPGCETQPAEGFDVAIRFNCDQLSDPEKFLENVADFRKNVMGGPLDRAFDSLANRTSDNLPPMTVEIRKNEPMFIVSRPGKIMVIFAVEFPDETDRALAKVFLQEFVEAQRTVRNAPPVSYSKEPPGELSNVSYAFKDSLAGFLSFSVEERHIAGPAKNKAISLLTGFRNYLHYHIKCSKTYLHMRMRKKVAGWMQVLNRAMPEVDTEKKTASGKTFIKK
jgi:actin related protein 2/3 complex subunit 2